MTFRNEALVGSMHWIRRGPRHPCYVRALRVMERCLLLGRVPVVANDGDPARPGVDNSIAPRGDSAHLSAYLAPGVICCVHVDVVQPGQGVGKGEQGKVSDRE